MPSGGAGAVYAKKANDFFDTPYPGTQVGIQAAIDYAGVGGTVYLGPGNFTGVNNLTMYSKQRLYGAGSLATSLTGTGAGTGIFLREKTAGEGNAGGATGIIVEGLSIFAGGHTGNGINFGNQGGASFNSLATLADVLVRDFTAGTGVKLAANAIHCRNVWSIGNVIGFDMAGGGGNHWDGFWSEANTQTQIRSSNAWDTWVHPQLEQNGVASTFMIEMLNNGSQNSWIGLYMALSFDTTTLVMLRAGAINNCFWTPRVVDNGHNYTDTFLVDAWTRGSGKKSFMPFWCDSANTQPSHMYNQSTNEDTQFIGASLAMDSFLSEKEFTLTDAATIVSDASIANSFVVTVTAARAFGAPANPRKGQRIAYRIVQNATGGFAITWNAVFKHAWADTGNTANKFSSISFRYDGTNWRQEGAQSPYIA